MQARTEQANRRGAAASRPAARALDAVLKAIDRQVAGLDRQVAGLDRQVAGLDRQVAALIRSDDDLSGGARLLRTAPGIGAAAAAPAAAAAAPAAAGATLLAELAELAEIGTIARRPLAALVGVAPFDRDSGAYSGKRATRSGRASVRCALYMATLAAVRFNPVIKPFADRLKRAGQANKVVIVACMRKLAALLNAMLRDGLTWDQLDAVKNA